MPNRIIKESINESRGLTDCAFVVQDFYKRLITYADDYGRFNADEEIMRARLYPREVDVVSVGDIQEWLIELAGIGKITFYTSTPRKEIYGCFPNWGQHQRLRDSKKRLPDPDDTEVNDWYLRRFVPLDMKVKILERDKCKCAICGKFLTSCTDAKKIVKLGQGLFHIDHIVPVVQGGRATMENLRATCPECNQKRKRYFTPDEILAITQQQLSDFPQSAASCGELPQISARARAESESESESESEVETEDVYSPAKPPDHVDEIPYALIIDDLNRVVGTNYRSSTQKTRRLIKARWTEGFRLDDFETVITKKAKEWMGTDMEKYLRPETLFGPKFEGYLNQSSGRHMSDAERIARL